MTITGLKAKKRKNPDPTDADTHLPGFPDAE